MKKVLEEKKILFKYEVLVYEDGSTETKRLPLEAPKVEEQKMFIDLNLVTGRIGQCLLTLKYLVERFNQFDFENEEMFFITSELKAAVKRVSEDYNVTENSILDKFLRQLKPISNIAINMDYLRDIINKYLEEMDSNPEQILIKDILINSVPKNTTKQDKQAINLFFNQPATPFILKNGKTV